MLHSLPQDDTLRTKILYFFFKAYQKLNTSAHTFLMGKYTNKLINTDH